MNYGKTGVVQKKKLLNSASKKIGTKAGVTIFKLALIFVVTLIVAGSCVVLGMVKGVIDTSPEITAIDVTPSGYATKVYDNNGDEIQTLVASGSNRISKSIDEIPLSLQHAFVAIEDERFYEHNGIDIKGIFRAAAIAIKNRDLSQGASTITQQLLKNNVFNAFNESTAEKIKRKIQEQYLAVKLETSMSKDEILDNYLNSINLGNGYLGVQAAASGYFDKDVSQLTLSECAVIASITQNPSNLNPVKYPEKNQVRQQQVLSNMLAQGYITQSEYDEAIDDDVYSRIQDLHNDNDTSAYTYFVDELIEQLTKDLVTEKGYTETQATNLIYKGGLSVYSTQDANMQDIADTVVNNPSWYPANTQFSISYALSVQGADGKTTNYSHQTMQKYFQTVGGIANFSLTFTDENKATAYVEQYKEAMVGEGDKILGESLSFTIQPQISFTLMDQHTGYVKVITGGRGEKTGSRTLNRATSTTRQPGSAIKPLAVYGPALDTGAITLATAVDDAPYYYSGSDAKLVTNFSKDYKGLMTARYAITISENVPAVKILTLITPQVGFNYLLKFGMSTLVSAKDAINGSHDVVQSLALGGMTKGVTNIDMTAAYAAIANQGTYTKPVYYTQIYDHDGNLLIDHTTSEKHQVLKKTTAWLLTNAMQDVVNSGTATLAKLPNQPVAGKTGTTNSEGDKWFCAFTPYYTASIWLGYDDNSTLVNSIKHVSIWQEIMKEIHSGMSTGTFEQPDGIVQLQVCSQSGKLAVEGLCDADPRGSQVTTEYFSEDNQPTETCDAHIKLKICNDTGLIASPECTNTSERIFVKKSSSGTLGGSDSYSVDDSQYTITDDFLNKICNHQHSTTTTPTVTDPQSQSSVAGGNATNSTETVAPSSTQTQAQTQATTPTQTNTNH